MCVCVCVCVCVLSVCNCFKDRLPDRHSCLKLYPCVIKGPSIINQSVNLLPHLQQFSASSPSSPPAVLCVFSFLTSSSSLRLLLPHLQQFSASSPSSPPAVLCVFSFLTSSSSLRLLLPHLQQFSASSPSSPPAVLCVFSFLTSSSSLRLLLPHLQQFSASSSFPCLPLFAPFPSPTVTFSFFFRLFCLFVLFFSGHFRHKLSVHRYITPTQCEIKHCTANKTLYCK